MFDTGYLDVCSRIVVFSSERGNATEDATQPAMNMHTDNPLLLTQMISKKVSLKKMTPAGWRQQVSKHTHTYTLSHTHTNHTVFCTLLSPVRVMILLYLHGFSYIDLDQEEAPPAGAPFLGSPPGSYCAYVCMCAKYQQLVCQQRLCVCGKRRRKEIKRRVWTLDLPDIFKRTDQSPHPHTFTQAHTQTHKSMCTYMQTHT